MDQPSFTYNIVYWIQVSIVCFRYRANLSLNKSSAVRDRSFFMFDHGYGLIEARCINVVVNLKL